MRKLFVGFLITLFLIVGCALAETAYVDTGRGNLRMRKEPSSKAHIVTQIPSNASVEILEFGEEWCQIQYKKYTGYVQTRFLRIPSSKIGQTLYAEESTVYVRSESNDRSAIVSSITYQTPVQLEAIEEKWLKVRCTDSHQQTVVGFVPASSFANLLTEPLSIAPDPDPSRLGNVQNETILYSLPDENSVPVVTLPSNWTVNILWSKDSWCQVEADSFYSGYILSENVKVTGKKAENKKPAKAATPYQATCYTASVPSGLLGVYSNTDQAEEPSVDQLLTIPDHARLTIVRRDVSVDRILWSSVRLDDGSIVWVHADDLKVEGTIRIKYSESVTEGVQCIAYPKEELALRDHPSQLSPAKAIIPKDEELEVSFGTDWSTVSWHGLSGYVDNDSLTFGFAFTEHWESEGLPLAKSIDTASLLSVQHARRMALNTLLQSITGFQPAHYTLTESLQKNLPGYSGPIYQFSFSDDNGKLAFRVLIHASDGKILYVGTYTGTADK